jgi:hypothetical protein
LTAAEHCEDEQTVTLGGVHPFVGVSPEGRVEMDRHRLRRPLGLGLCRGQTKGHNEKERMHGADAD